MDGQWGSTGKGKLAAWLTEKSDPAVSVCDFQANAGHTVVTDSGDKHVFQQLPVAALYPDIQLLMCPASTIDLPRLLQEIDAYGVQNRLLIHPHAAVITSVAKEYEAKTLKRISSTLKGCGGALGMKVMRHPDTVLARDCHQLQAFIGDTTERLQMFLRAGAMAIMETAQGFDLSLNHGHAYPYTTSRDITPASALNNVGVPVQLVGDVYGSIRTYPIRVGNIVEKGQKMGDSGPFYQDQAEINWRQLAEWSKSSVDLTEMTTVTGRVRRVFTFSERQFKRFLRVCAPTKLFVNFINHIDASDYGKRGWNELSDNSKMFINNLVSMCTEWTYATVPNPRVALIGTGEKTSDMVVLEGV